MRWQIFCFTPRGNRPVILYVKIFHKWDQFFYPGDYSMVSDTDRSHHSWYYLSHVTGTCHISPVTRHPSLVSCHFFHATCHFLPVTCHLSFVTFYLSLVTCYLSLVTRHLSSDPCQVESVRWEVTSGHLSLVTC